ncbi:MAG: transporter substrate-binding domain-containing protein [Alphaproteobacteria bacterium]
MSLLRHLAVATVAFLATAAGAEAGATLDRVMAARMLVMATDPTSPPQSFVNDRGEMDGFDVAVGREIAQRLGVALRIVTPAWHEVVAGDWRGGWDISVGSMTPTRRRARVLDFPAIYYYAPAAFAVPSQSGAHALADLDGKVIGTCGDCTYEDYLAWKLVLDSQDVPPFTFVVRPAEVLTFDTEMDAFIELRMGDGARLDAVIASLPAIEAAIRSGFPMRVLGPPVFYEPLAVAIDKGDPAFAARVRDVVGAMRSDGTLSSLSIRWHGTDLTRVR